jgi:hypothetical protein
LLQYVSDPRNATIISPQIAASKLNELVRRGILEQYETLGNQGAVVRVTRLNREDPLVIEALGDIE